MTSVIERHRRFGALCAEAGDWARVPVLEFRDRLLPLQKQAAWSEADAAYVRGWADRGIGGPLQALFGKHPEARRVLGASPIAAEPMARAEVEARLKRMLASCAVAGWTAGEYRALQAHLDAPPAASGDGGRVAARPEVDEDVFAAAYRTAGPAYRAAVQAALAAAADAAAA